MAPMRLVDPHSRVGLIGVYIIIVLSMTAALLLQSRQNDRTDELARQNQVQLAELKTLRQEGITQRRRADLNLCQGLEDVKRPFRRIIRQSDAQVDATVKRLPGFTRQDALDAHRRYRAWLADIAPKNCKTTVG